VQWQNPLFIYCSYCTDPVWFQCVWLCVSVFSLWLDFWCVGSATVWDTTTTQGILWSTNRLDFWKLCSQICSLEIDWMSSASWYIHIRLGWSSILSLLRHRSVVYTGIHHHAILPPTQHFTRLIRGINLYTSFLIYELWSLLKEVQQRGQSVSQSSQSGYDMQECFAATTISAHTLL
jgi:hypothetical protein